MKVAVTGVSGFLGSALKDNLVADGHEVLGLTRGAELPEPVRTVRWDVANGRFDASPLEGIDAVVHLAGASVAKRWTPTHRKAILDSRVEGTKLLVRGLGSLSQRPSVLVCASAVGLYGDRGSEELDEGAEPGRGFLPEVCREWEAAASEATELGIRCVCLRIGIVLSTKGGALQQMLLPFKLGLGGPVGSGRQWMSWVHLDDVIGAMRFAIDESSLEGAANLTAPAPVENRTFAKALGRALGRPAFLPAPGFALKLLFGEMAQGLLLEGQRVLPRKLQAAGFRFAHPELGPALTDVIARSR